MNRLFSRKNLPKDLIRLEISTPLANHGIETGQYIVVRTVAGEKGMTLPVVRCDRDRGTITAIVSPCSGSTEKVDRMPAQSIFHAVEGPYGLPVQVRCLETVLCVGDEKGIVALLPVIIALRKAGNRVVVLLTAPTSRQVLLEEEINAAADEVIILTREDKSGLPVSLEQTVARIMRNHSVQGVYVAGSARTVRDTFAMTINHPVPTQALLVDTPANKSVHGIFRVSICGNERSVCVDGHDFNAYYASFDEMVRRFELQQKEKAKAADTLQKTVLQV